MTDAAAAPATGAPTTPSPAPAESAAAPPAAADEPAPQPRNAVEAIVAKARARESQQAKEAPADAPPGAAGDGKAAPAGDKPPPAEHSALQFAKLKKEHRELTASSLEWKGKAEAAAKELEGIKAKFQRNAFKALEEVTGKTFKEHVERAARGEYDERGQLPPDVQAKLDKFEQWQKDDEAQKAQQKQAAERQDDVNFANSFLKEHAADYPVFGAADWAADELVDRAYALLKSGTKAADIDLRAMAAELEQRATMNLEQLLGNERILTALVKRPGLRQVLVKALGPSEQQSATRPASSKPGESNAGNGPRTLSHTATQEAPVPPPQASEESEADWEAGALARLQQFKQRGRIVG